jgi:hypothetical protein
MKSETSSTGLVRNTLDGINRNTNPSGAQDSYVGRREWLANGLLALSVLECLTSHNFDINPRRRDNSYRQLVRGIAEL